MHILIWLLAALSLGLWTLLAWATAWVLGLDPTALGSWSGQVSQMPGAAWLDLWVPGWESLLAATVELVKLLFSALGTVGPWLVWGTWAVGAVLIVGLAALCSVAVGLVRRASRPNSGTPPLAGQA
jgi:hypothetical protein